MLIGGPCPVGGSRAVTTGEGGGCRLEVDDDQAGSRLGRHRPTGQTLGQLAIPLGQGVAASRSVEADGHLAGDRHSRVVLEHLRKKRPASVSVSVTLSACRVATGNMAEVDQSVRLAIRKPRQEFKAQQVGRRGVDRICGIDRLCE